MSEASILSQLFMQSFIFLAFDHFLRVAGASYCMFVAKFSGRTTHHTLVPVIGG